MIFEWFHIFNLENFNENLVENNFTYNFSNYGEKNLRIFKNSSEKYCLEVDDTFFVLGLNNEKQFIKNDISVFLDGNNVFLGFLQN